MKTKTVPAAGKIIPVGGKAWSLLLLLAGAIFLGILVGQLADPAEPAAASGIDPAEPSGPPSGSNPQSAARPADVGAPSFGLDQTFTGVWVVLCAFVVIGVVLVVLLKAGRRLGGGNGALHVVDTLPLSGRRLIHLVRCGDRKYLIGNSEKGIHYLASLPVEPAEREVDENPALDPFPGDAAQQTQDQFEDAGEPSFASLLPGGRSLR